MKKLVILLFFISIGVSAQNMRHEKIKELKIAFFTEQLDLSSSEAEKFWPIYNAHDNKMNSLRRKERTEIYEIIQVGVLEMSDIEANAFLYKSIEYKKQELELQTQLIKDLRKVLSPQRIIQLRKAEEEFKRRLLEHFRQNRRGNKN